MSAPAVVTDHLSKIFPARRGWRRLQRPLGVTAVRDVSLTVEDGELFGLLGPNGAGKTTLVKMLCTLIAPSSGRAVVAGCDLSAGMAIRAAVGLVVADERSFYWRISARRNLRFFAAMHGLTGAAAEQRIDEVLEAVQLRERADTPFSDFSTGMKQRMAIARGLLHRPRLLFLDEPTRSLDPTATAELHVHLLRLMQERRMTVFLITHDLAEAEKLCTRVAVMHRGRVQAVGSPADLRRHLRPQRRYTLTVDRIDPAAVAALEPLVDELQCAASQLTFSVGESGRRLTAALDCLRAHDIAIHTIEGQPPTLEEVFAQLTQPEP